MTAGGVLGSSPNMPGWLSGNVPETAWAYGVLCGAGSVMDRLGPLSLVWDPVG